MKQKLEEIGKKYGEKLSMEVIEGVFEVLDVVVEESENKIDDVIYASLKSMAKEELKKIADKIYKEE